MSNYFAYAWVESTNEVFQLESPDAFGLTMGLCDLYDRHGDLIESGGLIRHEFGEEVYWLNYVDQWREDSTLDGHFLTYFFDKRLESYIPFETVDQIYSLQILSAFILQMNEQWRGEIYRVDIFLKELGEYLLEHSLETNLDGLPIEVGISEDRDEMLIVLSYFEIEIAPLGGITDDIISQLSQSDGDPRELLVEIVEVRELESWWHFGKLQVPTYIQAKILLNEEGGGFFEGINEP